MKKVWKNQPLSITFLPLNKFHTHTHQEKKKANLQFNQMVHHFKYLPKLQQVPVVVDVSHQVHLRIKVLLLVDHCQVVEAQVGHILPAAFCELGGARSDAWQRKTQRVELFTH